MNTYFDRKALEKLESFEPLELVVRKFNQYGIEKILRIQYTGSNLKVTPNNFPGVYDALIEACTILDLPFVPQLYICWNYIVNAFTAGSENPIIVLNSGCIDLLTHEELLFILGHEVGHIKSEHVLYHQMASVIPFMGNLLASATLGLGGLVTAGLEIALYNWKWMSEFTADRAGLLACQDPRVAASALAKAAGAPVKYHEAINVDEFIVQAREFEGYDYDALDKAAKVFSIMWQDHPWTVMRAAESFRWIDSGEYGRIIRAGTEYREAKRNASTGTGIEAWVSSKVREFEQY